MMYEEAIPFGDQIAGTGRKAEVINEASELTAARSQKATVGRLDFIL